MFDNFSGTYVISHHITTRFIGEEVFLMNLETLKTYYLNETAAQVWSLIGETKTFEEILDTLMKYYEVSQDGCMSDVSHIMELFLSEHLIDKYDEHAGAS